MFIKVFLWILGCRKIKNQKRGRGLGSIKTREEGIKKGKRKVLGWKKAKKVKSLLTWEGKGFLMVYRYSN